LRFGRLFGGQPLVSRQQEKGRRRERLIGTLAYSVRIAGTRTRRIALSLSLFNVLILVPAALWIVALAEWL